MYEQLLTAVKLSVNEYQRRSFARPSEAIFDEIDTLSRQTIILRRHFWRVRNIINLVHNEHDKEEIKYIDMVYDDISQLIDFVESYEGTINSIRELYVAKVSLQINDYASTYYFYCYFITSYSNIGNLWNERYRSR